MSMLRLMNRPAFRAALFRQFFIKYFALILVPAIAATIFTNVFVVRLIERDAEGLSAVMLRQDARQTDAGLKTLESGMIQLLSSPLLKTVLQNSARLPQSPEQAEPLYAMMAQMNALRSEPFVSGAFLYFTNADLVLDNNLYAGKSFYFSQQYALAPAGRERLLSALNGKKMMFFTEPYEVRRPGASAGSGGAAGAYDMSVVMSFPFNAERPEALLAVQLDREKLRQLAPAQESWLTGTAIVDAGRSVIVRSDAGLPDAAALSEVIRHGAEGALHRLDGKRAAFFLRSEFYPDWHYVSLIDAQSLMRPARTLYALSIGFMLFFLLVGTVVSYSLSRRLYHPISEIRRGLQAHPAHERPEDAADPAGSGNDFDLIRRFSRLLMHEHKELSQRVRGIQPIVQEDFVVRMLLGEFRDELSIGYYAKEIAFPFEPRRLRAVLVIEYHWFAHVQLSETSKTFLLAEMKDHILKTLSGDVWFGQTRSDALACIVHPEDASQSALLALAGAVRQALGSSADYMKATIGVGCPVAMAGELHSSYALALAMLKQKSLNAGVDILVDSEARDEREPLDSFLSAEEVNRITNMCRAGEAEAALTSALHLLEQGRQRQTGAFQMKSLVADLLNTWIRAVETQRDDLSISLYAELFEALNRCQTWEELRDCLIRVHGVLFPPPADKSRHEQLEEVACYIRDHYDEELSIEQFAASLHMSVSHFSRTFKEVVGEKYMEYITKVRLGEAKRLLQETDLKIEEIATRVGYLGSNAFIRIFRKYEGVTPGKFRGISK